MREWLKEIRERKGLTMTAVAQASGMDTSQYSKIEKGKIKQISVNVAKRIANVLDIPMSKFFEGETYGKLKVRIGQFGFTHKQLAEKIGIPRSRMSEKLSGKRDFTWGEVKKICLLVEIKDPFEFFE